MATRTAAMALLRTRSLNATSRVTGISRSTLRAWRHDTGPPRDHGCPLCAGRRPTGPPCTALLGFYLGDGCISRGRGYYSLRVSCDASYEGIIDDVVGLMASMRPGQRVFRVRAPGVVAVHANWLHWPCLFPQHGPGRKHERPIVLEDWQRDIVEAHPGEFLRGRFHSDGSRVRNWATRVVAASASATTIRGGSSSAGRTTSATSAAQRSTGSASPGASPIAT